jgi:hypothetical protein
VLLRELRASNAELARKLIELERKLKGHDEAITAILSAIRELMNPPAPKRRGIGFTADLEATKWRRHWVPNPPGADFSLRLRLGLLGLPTRKTTPVTRTKLRSCARIHHATPATTLRGARATPIASLGGWARLLFSGRRPKNGDQTLQCAAPPVV